MEITVEGVSATGVVANDKWYNVAKGADIEFKGKVFKGDVVDLTLNDKGYVTAYKTVTAAPPKPAFKKSFGGGGSTSMTPEREASINRAVAVKAVFELPNVHRMFDEKSDEEAMAYAFKLSEKVTQYLSKGI